jgi:hypothetical protein
LCWCSDWRVTARVINYIRVERAIDCFVLYKTPGMDGMFPVLLQEGREIVIPYLLRIFRACLSTGYVPAVWQQVRVVFIPKPGRNCYSGPRGFRPISLTSFLRTMEWLVDRYLRDDKLTQVPLHPNQHAYQAGKSVGTALHQLLVQVERALNHQETTLCVVLDIEEACNMCYETMCNALFRRGVITPFSVDLDHPGGPCGCGNPQWFLCEGCGSTGCPQGGVLSPHLWCLVVDLIARLS